MCERERERAGQLGHNLLNFNKFLDGRILSAIPGEVLVRKFPLDSVERAAATAAAGLAFWLADWPAAAAATTTANDDDGERQRPTAGSGGGGAPSD